MGKESMFICVIAVAAVGFALFNTACLMIKRNSTAQTEGTILSFVLVNPEKAKSNSKWAIVTYKVNGRMYTSQNRIQVPMAAQIGSSVKIRYDVARPEKLYSFSWKRVLLALLVAAVCLIVLLL